MSTEPVSQASASANEEKDERPAALIIGDWFIDENWLVTRQNLYRATAAGDSHYLSKHKSATERITNLCGAAALMEVLRRHFRSVETVHKGNGTTSDDDAQANNQAPPEEAAGTAKTKGFDLVGYGVWHEKDEHLLKCFLCSNHPDIKYVNPYTAIGPIDPGESNICPYSKLKEKKDGENGSKQHECEFKIELRNLAHESKEEVSTNRVIRVFEGTSRGRPHQLYRLDWERPVPENLSYDELRRDIEQRRDRLMAVIIEDHANRVVTPTLIRKVIQALKDKKVDLKKLLWFIRTKSDNPTWMKELADEQISPELVVTDFKVADQKKGARRWWHGETLGCSALELLGELTGDVYYMHCVERHDRGFPAKSAAVYLDDNTVFAKEDDTCYLLPRPAGPRQPINMERTTIFNAALIAQRLTEYLEEKKRAADPGEKRPEGKFGHECWIARQCAYKWTRNASEFWRTENLHLYGEYQDAINSAFRAPERREFVRTEIPVFTKSYKLMWNEWNASFTNLGVVEVRKDDEQIDRVLQLWRGEGALANYVCAGGPKRDRINHLVGSIGHFLQDKNPKLPYSCLLISAPGWGKSYLASCLAKQFDMDCAAYSLAEMSDTRDVIECLADVASIQARSDKKTLVFIDEINAKIEGNYAMSLLLSPLWGGTFVKDGKNHRLQPCVWVFASTARQYKLEGFDKGSDFISRLNGPIIELDSMKAEARGTRFRRILVSANRAQRTIRAIGIRPAYTRAVRNRSQLGTQQVYLMVSLLRSHWGPIGRIQYPVLKLFSEVKPKNGVRSLEIFSARFKEIQRGEIRKTNVPTFGGYDELRRHIEFPTTWNPIETAADENDWIKIETVYQESPGQGLNLPES